VEAWRRGGVEMRGRYADHPALSTTRAEGGGGEGGGVGWPEHEQREQVSK
jgi:hypothetical protein